MNTTSLQSILNKAREQFENGHAKACVEMLKGVLGDLKVGEPEWYRLRNDTTFLLAGLSIPELDRVLFTQRREEWEQLPSRVNQLLLDFEAAVKKMVEATSYKNTTYSADLIFELGNKRPDLNMIKGWIIDLESTLRKSPNFLQRTIARPGSKIVKMELYAQEIVKIKSLIKLELVDNAVEFKVFHPAWDWIEAQDFVFCLEELDLRRAPLTGANLGGANFRGTNLCEADLRSAILVCADLRGAELNDTDFRSAQLNGAIFYETDRELLESMGVDISEVIFVDNGGKEVDSWVDVE